MNKFDQAYAQDQGDNVTLKNIIDEHFTNALKEKAEFTGSLIEARVRTLRLLKSEIARVESAGKVKKILSDSEIIAIIKKQYEQRIDSMNTFQKAGRHDLATTESLEAVVLEDYLPKYLSEDETREWVNNAIEIHNIINIGQLMKLAKDVDEIDNKVVSTIARELL